MSQEERHARLADELERLRALKKTSTIFDFEVAGGVPDRYTIHFHGKGLARDASVHSRVETIELHKIDLRLPYSYPESPPDIRWITPIWHPNVSFSGLIGLKDIGLPWQSDVGLDVICERLWDVARLAYLNLDKPTNYSAKNWYEQDCTLQLPVDARPLRDRHAPSGSNVVRYERRGGRRVPLAEVASSEVLFIGEDTPTPQLPRPPALPRRRWDDDEVFYIGDE